MKLNEIEIIEIFKETKALLEGHFILTSGKHSDKYFQCAKVLQYPDYTSMICSKMASPFKQSKIDAVIAPAMGGIVVGYEVARLLGKRFVFAEREEGIMKLRRNLEIYSGESVLVCEDVVTTGGSVFEVIEIVKNAGAKAVGVTSIVDRSFSKIDFGCEFIPAVKLEAKAFEPVECPLCKENISFTKPGSRGNK